MGLRKILTDKEERFNAVVEFLLKHETMSGAQFAACMEGKTVEDSADTVLLDGFETALSAKT